MKSFYVPPKSADRKAVSCSLFSIVPLAFLRNVFIRALFSNDLWVGFIAVRRRPCSFGATGLLFESVARIALNSLFWIDNRILIREFRLIFREPLGNRATIGHSGPWRWHSHLLFQIKRTLSW